MLKNAWLTPPTILPGWRVTSSIAGIRYWLAGVLGLPDKDPHEDLFKDAKALDPGIRYPQLEELKAVWHKVSPPVYQALLLVEEAELSQPYAFGMDTPYVEENKLNMVGMSLDREGYLLGQLGLMRKALGYEGVRYDLDDELSY